MRIGMLEIEVTRGRRRRVVRAELSAPSGPRVQVKGTLLRAVTMARNLTRRDDRSWAVLQAARGHYELVPLSVTGSADHPEAHALGQLAGVAGVSSVTVSRLTGQLVAIASVRTPFVFRGEQVSLSDPR